MTKRILSLSRRERDIADRLAETNISLLNMNDDRTDAGKEILKLREIIRLRGDEIKALQQKINFKK